MQFYRQWNFDKTKTTFNVIWMAKSLNIFTNCDIQISAGLVRKSYFMPWWNIIDVLSEHWLSREPAHVTRWECCQAPGGCQSEEMENTTLARHMKPPRAPQAPSLGPCLVPAILYFPECVVGYFALIQSIVMNRRGLGCKALISFIQLSEKK